MKPVPLRFFALALVWPLASSAGVQLAVNGEMNDEVSVGSPWQFNVAWFVDDSKVTACRLMYPGAPEGGLKVPSYSESAPSNFRMDYFNQMLGNTNGKSVDLTVSCTDADGNLVSDQATVNLVPDAPGGDRPVPPPPWVVGQVTPDLRVALLPYHSGDQVTFSWQLDPDRVKLDSCIGVIDRAPFQNISPIYDTEEPNNGLGAEDSTFPVDQIQGEIQLTLQQSVKLEVDCEVTNTSDGQAYFVGTSFPSLDVKGDPNSDGLYAQVDNQEIVAEATASDSDSTDVAVETGSVDTTVATGNGSDNTDVAVETGSGGTTVAIGNGSDNTDVAVETGNGGTTVATGNGSGDTSTDDANTDVVDASATDSAPIITDVKLKLLSLFPRHYHLSWTSENSAFCALAGHVKPVGDYPISQLPPSGETVFATPTRGSKQVFLVCQSPQGQKTLLKLRGKHTCDLCKASESETSSTATSSTAQTSKPDIGNRIGIILDANGRLWMNRKSLSIGPDAMNQGSNQAGQGAENMGGQNSSQDSSTILSP